MATLVASSALAQSQPPGQGEAVGRPRQPVSEIVIDGGITNPIHLVCQNSWNNPKSEGKTRCEYEQPPKDWWPVGLGLLTLAALIAQCLIYWRQAGIMRQALLAQRRPKFLVREMILKSITERSLHIDCVISNAGDAAGTIVSSFANLQLVAPQDWRPEGADESGNLLRNKDLPPGGQIGWGFGARIGDGTLLSLANAQEIIRIHGQQHPTSVSAATIYLRGCIIYKDSFDIERTTAFFRRLNAWTYRFETMGEEGRDYEYAD